MHLVELQKAFWAAVRTRGSAPPGLDTLFTPGRAQSASERLAVYHIAYWHRQLAALSATFPRTQALLAGRFERLVFGYIEKRPCTEPCIERLGADFPEFLAERSDVSTAALGVARLEWTETEALLAPNPRAVRTLPRHLGASFAECRLEFVPSLRIAHVLKDALEWFESSQHDPSAMVDSSTIDVAFYRPEFAVRHAALATDEARAYSLAAGGASIALICAAFSALPEAQAATRAVSVLSSWFARGWIERCEP
jgi:hypothetical protein